MAWGSEWGWKPYVSVSERREKATRHMEKRQKRGLAVQPVTINGRKIARTFWGQSWCTHLESFSDFENRLPRGRTYVCNGSVCHLEIGGGEIKAVVIGSEVYDVKVSVKKLPEQKWSAVKEKCVGQIGSLLELLQGKLSNGVMSVVTNRKDGLFPLPGEISMDCSCPDWADMCKHIAATMYGVGARLDEKPELLFVLRGVDHEELIEADTAALSNIDERGGARRIAEGDLADVFGIDLIVPEKSPDASPRQSKLKAVRVAKSTGAPSAKEKKNAVRKTEPLSRASSAPQDQRFTGKSVRELRARFDMSQSVFAALIGVSSMSVGKWEKERRLNLQPRTMNALSTAMKLTKKQAWKQLDQGLNS